VPVYLDHSATSPIRPAVLADYTATLAEIGNPAAIHSFGQATRQILEQAREDLAAALDCDRNEVIFTSGGTESDNLAIKGLYWSAHQKDPNRTLIISSAAEHHAVLDAIDWLVQEQGAEAFYLPHNPRGEIDPEDLAQLLKRRGDEVALISLMWANNEIGVINPITEITALAKPYSIPVHSDAIAALGHTPVSFAQSGLSAMTITGHKLGSPVGIGALILARSQSLTPVLHGGGQERKLRSGTPDAAAARALALTISAAQVELNELANHHLRLREKLISAVRELAPEVVISGAGANRLPNIVHLRFPGCLGDSLLFLLDLAGVSISTGSACTAGVAGPSHVILALGAEADEAMATMRISFGYNTAERDVDAFLAALPAALTGARKAGLTRK
jgi:cysteine desulfurase